MFAYTPAESLINMPFTKAGFFLCCVLTLTACGGGGGSDTPANNNATNQPPTNVALTTVQASSSDVIDVAWTLAKDDKTIASTLTYQVHLSETAGFSPASETLKFSQKGAVATKLTGLKPATAYSLKLVVIDDDGAQTVSAERTVITQNINVVNQPPTNVALATVQAISSTGVSASWGAASDDTTAASQLTYEVHMAEGGDFSPSASSLKFSGKNVFMTPVTGLKAATTYTVKLVAIDAQGLRSSSSGVSVTTQNIAAVNKAPTNVALNTVQATSPTAVNVYWWTANDDTTAVSQLTYEVHMAEGGDFSPSAS
ncbi:fibronectin type III domain-containing protein, partial [uncultured Acinetobacter sp.]|uniref:fibronectin type III domain-containing protein n=1 Tax=uncultured Acinetobacter sp. TaxID=165433 RepID=UPI00262348A0